MAPRGKGRDTGGGIGVEVGVEVEVEISGAVPALILITYPARFYPVEFSDKQSSN